MKRPGIEEFIEKASKMYEVIVFTASMPRYANPLLDHIDPRHLISYRLFREDCTFVGDTFIKDLSVLGRDLSNTLIIDNCPGSYSFQPHNALPIDTWIDDKSDTQLYDTLPILEALKDEIDVRETLKKIVRNNKVDYKNASKILKETKEPIQQIIHHERESQLTVDKYSETLERLARLRKEIESKFDTPEKLINHERKSNTTPHTPIGFKYSDRKKLDNRTQETLDETPNEGKIEPYHMKNFINKYDVPYSQKASNNFNRFEIPNKLLTNYNSPSIRDVYQLSDKKYEIGLLTKLNNPKSNQLQENKYISLYRNGYKSSTEQEYQSNINNYRSCLKYPKDKLEKDQCLITEDKNLEYYPNDESRKEIIDESPEETRARIRKEIAKKYKNTKVEEQDYDNKPDYISKFHSKKASDLTNNKESPTECFEKYKMSYHRRSGTETEVLKSYPNSIERRPIEHIRDDYNSVIANSKRPDLGLCQIKKKYLEHKNGEIISLRKNTNSVNTKETDDYRNIGHNTQRMYQRKYNY